MKLDCLHFASETHGCDVNVVSKYLKEFFHHYAKFQGLTDHNEHLFSSFLASSVSLVTRLESA